MPVGGVYYVMIEQENIQAGKMGIGCLGLGVYLEVVGRRVGRSSDVGGGRVRGPKTWPSSPRTVAQGARCQPVPTAVNTGRRLHLPVSGMEE